MLFSFQCPSCKGRLEGDASQSGAQSACPQCGSLVVVPEGRIDTGTTLAGFRLERRLGKGGMGEVYLARQLSVDRQVAVKILPPGFAADKRAVARFLQEGKLAARLDHQHIATVYEAGEDGGHYYMAMAYIEGESLDQRLKRDTVLPEDEALRVVRAVANALAYAWAEFQLLHRDIKPANIMLDRRGRVFLMDLGLAKSVGEGEGLTLSGAILGTPQYMSPEQGQGLELGVASDIYSLGATLYHLATGSPPFSGDSLMKVLNQHIHAPLPPPRERNPRLSEGCARLVETMMAKEPGDRYGDWQALLAALDLVLAHGGPAASGEELPPPVPSSAPATPTPRRVRRWAYGLAIAAVVMALALWALSRPRQGDQAAEQTGPSSPVAGPTVGRPWTVPGLGMEFVYVAPGSYRMGTDRGKTKARPVHDVRISQAFWLGKYEVTQEEYEALAGSNPSRFQAARNPVERVSWQQAMSFCGILTERERAAGRLPAGYEYRLPTEAEWEYAARGGDKPRGFACAGSDDPYEVGWYRENSGDSLATSGRRNLGMLRENDCRPRPVGGKKANELGIHDLSGNVAEWCHDWFQGGYSSLPSVDPSGPSTGTEHVQRGGSWISSSVLGTVFSRGGARRAVDMRGCAGFRVALAVPVVLPAPR